MYRWLELMFNPRNKMEQYISKSLKFIHPYLAFVTYRFHVEKARESGKIFHFPIINKRSLPFITS